MPKSTWHKYKAAQQAREQRNRELIRKAKEAPCVDCGVEFPPAAMCFDHVSGAKSAAVGRLKSCSPAVIEAEIAKCEIRCSNCHMIRTYGADA